MRLAAILLAAAVFFSATAARAGVPTADADEIRALLASEPGSVLVLDVRTPGEFALGHIPEAVSIPMSDIPWRLGEIPREKKIVAVCASGARSGAVTDYLIEQGYPWVKNYAGGMVDWARKKLPISK